MIDRYKTKEMEEIWNEKAKINCWAKIEIAVAEEMYNNKEISAEQIEEMVSAPIPTLKRIAEIEKETDHDFVAFIRAYSEGMGEAGRFLHKGLTSSDVIDTATSMAINKSLNIIFSSLLNFSNLLQKKNLKYMDLPCVGRTHGIHAEPTSFGRKFASWDAECIRNIQRIYALLNSFPGKLSGAVGNYSQNSFEFEEKVLDKLNIKQEVVATQVIPRDRHAELISILALIGTMIERIATEIRSLQRTEIGEVEEYFKKGQTGSSAMPHKHNPIVAERLCGIARILRSYIIVSYENVALWHERDISHSCNERIILPDVFHLTHYSINKIHQLIDTLVVFEDKVRENINKTNGLIYSQNILSLMVLKGIDRMIAYNIIQEAAHEVKEKCFSYLICKKIKEKLPDFKIGLEFVCEMLSLMRPEIYLKNINKLYGK